MASRPLIIKDTAEDNRQKFQQALNSQEITASRTLEALRKLILFDSPEGRKTELADLPRGKYDPQLQLMLMARDEFIRSDDSVSKLGFYKAMRDMHTAMEERCMKVLDMAMRERHHQEKMAAIERKNNSAEPTDAEVDASLGDAT